MTKASGSKKVKGAPRSKQSGANDSPSRTRYWSSGRLEKRKVTAIMKNKGCSQAQASLEWHAARQGRIKT